MPEKKTVGYQERNEEARIQFKRQLELYSDKKIIYIDESGINNNEIYPYGWSKKGKRFYSFRPGQRQERLSIVGALCEEKFLAPIVYQGYCTAQVIEVWLEKVLLPLVVAPSVIIMDNASFHKSRKIREFIEKAGCELLFLPPYSPEFNPIEHWWHQVKTAIREQLPLYDFNIHKATDAAFQDL